MSQVILALDQGTSSTRCIAFDRDLHERGRAVVPVTCAFPGPGLVEQDPSELARSAEDALTGALADGGLAWSDVAAVSIANQTETFVIWDRATGRPVHPAIVWQDPLNSDFISVLCSPYITVKCVIIATISTFINVFYK